MSGRAAETIEVAVGDPDELFERLSPSPSRGGRHLDEGVERFILHRAQDGRAEYSLVVGTSNAALDARNTAALADGIRAHFAHRAEEESLKIRALVTAGRRDIMIGLIFLFTCAVLGLIGTKFLPRALGLFVEQGLLILGWVALWRPVDLFLYELRPLRTHRAVLSALARMDVRFDPAGPNGGP